MVTQPYLFLCDTKSTKDLRLRVVSNRPDSDILLFKNRLYMHEYLTHPPLRDLRVCIKEDEGPLRDPGLVAFVVSLVLRSTFYAALMTEIT